MLTDAEARFGIVVMTPLAIESGGVSFLAAVVAAPTLARLFADGGCEDNFYLPNLLCQVGPYERKKVLSGNSISRPGELLFAAQAPKHSQCKERSVSLPKVVESLSSEVFKKRLDVAFSAVA